jgi:hypothetical protein
LYCHLIACTGWSWEYIDESITLPRLYAMNAYWAKNPPVHLLLRQFFGYRPPPDSKAPDGMNAERDLAVFMQAFREAGGTVV